VTVEYAVATCTHQNCDWNDAEPLADIRATEHNEATGHLVLVGITAHIGALDAA
jgi:hypothetical protein